MGHMGHWVGDHSLTQSHSPGRLAANDSKCRQAVYTVPSSPVVARSSCGVNKLSDVLLGTGHSATFMTKTVMVLSGLERNKIYTELAGGYEDLSQKVIQIQIFEHLDFYVLYPILSRIHFIC